MIIRLYPCNKIANLWVVFLFSSLKKKIKNQYKPNEKTWTLWWWWNLENNTFFYLVIPYMSPLKWKPIKHTATFGKIKMHMST